MTDQSSARKERLKVPEHGSVVAGDENMVVV